MGLIKFGEKKRDMSLKQADEAIRRIDRILYYQKVCIEASLAIATASVACCLGAFVNVWWFALLVAVPAEWFLVDRIADKVGIARSFIYDYDEL